MFKISDLIHEIDVRSGGRLASRCLDGAEDCTVSGFGPIENARPDQVVFLAQPRLRAAAKDCKAGVLVISESDLKEMYGDSDPARPVVVTANTYAWFAWAVQAMLQQPPPWRPKSLRSWLPSLPNSCSAITTNAKRLKRTSNVIDGNLN